MTVIVDGPTTFKVIKIKIAPQGHPETSVACIFQSDKSLRISRRNQLRLKVAQRRQSLGSAKAVGPRAAGGGVTFNSCINI